MAVLIRGDNKTVNAYQDSILGDFAFSGKDGIIKNVGENCAYDIEGMDIKIKSGMVVIQGRQIVFDGTERVTLPSGGLNNFSKIYIELNMAARDDVGDFGKVSIKALTLPNNLPEVPISDDLKLQPQGTAYLPLYQVQHSGTSIPFDPQLLAELLESNGISEATKKEIDEINKDVASLEKRLDELGFNQGSTTISGATLTKQAKYAILTLPGGDTLPRGTISFKAKNTVTVYGVVSQPLGGSGAIYLQFPITIEGNEVKPLLEVIPSGGSYGALQIGFEIE